MPVADHNCEHCNKVFRVNSCLGQRFCSHTCGTQSSRRQTKEYVTLTCAFCAKSYAKAKTDIKRSVSGLRFCSRRCNNESRHLGSGVDGHRPSHFGTRTARVARPRTPAKDFTKAEVRLLKGDAGWRQFITRRASYAFSKTDKPRFCPVCGYSLHIEVCHIKAVSSFPPEALLSEINNPDNLVAMCRRHHWEYDHGHISLPT